MSPAPLTEAESEQRVWDAAINPSIPLAQVAAMRDAHAARFSRRGEPIPVAPGQLAMFPARTEPPPWRSEQTRLPLAPTDRR